MYYVNAYHDIIHWWIYNYLQFPWNGTFFYDILVYNKWRHNMQWHNIFSRYFFLNMNFIFPTTIKDINEEYLLKIGEVIITFCNGNIYYGSPCTWPWGSYSYHYLPHNAMSIEATVV